MDNNINSDKLREMLAFQIKREMTAITKNSLNILEDLLEQGYHFDYNNKRKILLDSLGEKYREIENFLTRFEIKLK